MSNHALPTLSSAYANFLSEMSARVDDAVKQSRSDTVTFTNPPVGAIRWDVASGAWKQNTGTVEVPVWSNLASTYAINVSTANAWATGRTITVSGDVGGTSAAWTGSGNISFAATLATVNANVGSFGSASAVPVLTVNAKGLVTAVSTTALGGMATQAPGAVAITGGAISGTSLTLVQSTTAAPTVEGRIEWDTDQDQLKVGDGTGTKVISPDDVAATLTNKTLTSPVLTTPTLGTPVSGNLANCSFPTLNQSTTGTAAIATTTTVTDDITTDAVVYPTWATASSGNQAQKTSSTKLTFNPSTGVFSATSFTGAGTGLTGTAASLTAGAATTAAACTGNAATVTNGVYTSGDQTIAGTKTFSSPIAGSVTGSSASCTGNAATVTNGVYTSGDQAIGGTKTFSAFYSSSQINFSGGSAGFMEFVNRSAGALGYKFYTGASGGVLSLTLDTSSNLTAVANVTAYSDERVKTNWRGFGPDFIKQLAQVKSGTYDRTDVELTQIGVSAQSLQTLMPHAVLEDAEGRLSVAYGSAALAACVELAKYVVALRAEIAGLKAN